MRSPERQSPVPKVQGSSLAGGTKSIDARAGGGQGGGDSSFFAIFSRYYYGFTADTVRRAFNLSNITYFWVIEPLHSGFTVTLRHYGKTRTQALYRPLYSGIYTAKSHALNAHDPPIRKAYT